MPFQPNLANTLIFLSFFILAFFPHIFVNLAKFPLNAISQSKYLSPHTQRNLSSTLCTPIGKTLTMSWFQKTITLPAKSRGSYLITDTIEQQLPEIRNYKVGLLNLFAQHTSCALSLNENWDEDVRTDMSDAIDRIVPEDKHGNLYRHSAEGKDDMPVSRLLPLSKVRYMTGRKVLICSLLQAHVKTALIGASVTIPISNGRLATGTWQGIWYLEFRTARHSRKLVATIQGEKA
jgi:secondary thiamine-phosphate synthase enzyme